MLIIFSYGFNGFKRIFVSELHELRQCGNSCNLRNSLTDFPRHLDFAYFFESVGFVCRKNCLGMYFPPCHKLVVFVFKDCGDHVNV